MSIEDEGSFPEVVYLLYRGSGDADDDPDALRLVAAYPTHAEVLAAVEDVIDRYEIARDELVVAVQGIGDVQWVDGFITLPDDASP